MWTWRGRGVVSQHIVPKLKPLMGHVAELPLGRQPEQLRLVLGRRDAREGPEGFFKGHIR